MCIRDRGYVTSIFLDKYNLAAAFRIQKLNCNPSEILDRYNNSEISIRTNTFDFQGTNLALNNTRFFLGTITSDSDSSGAGVYMDNGGAFRLFGDSTNFITVDGGSMAIGTDDLILNTAKVDIIFLPLIILLN